jgi:hypothetical protein
MPEIIFRHDATPTRNFEILPRKLLGLLIAFFPY